MRLAGITIENYRSITKAYKVRMGARTVLVGPNNEGKSNVLRALVTAMHWLQLEGTTGDLDARMSLMRLRDRSRDYDWERDFPIHLQKDQPDGKSEIVLEFEFSPVELEDFRSQIKSSLTGNLPLRFGFGKKTRPLLRVYKKGPGSEALSRKSPKIAKFVSERIRIEHIPAVRTARAAESTVERLVAQQLERVESDMRYQSAVSEIAAVQDPLLSELAASIKSTLIRFLPDVKDVRITIPRDERYRALRQSCSVIINDGTPTELQFKGDGVQSLAALAIMRFASDKESAAKHAVIAIEEPESHLHPAAIHALRDVVLEMSQRNQVVLTTHNALFVDRTSVESNIIVNNNKARPARSIAQVRDVLGVRAPDNLRNAELALVVEGEDDRVALSALFSTHSSELRSALSSGLLCIDSLQGGANLAYKLGALRESLCSTFAFLDDDEAGRHAVGKAEMEGLLHTADYMLAHCEGRQESELEDLYDPAVYAELIRSGFGVQLVGPKFRNSKKWSVRVRGTFEQQGKHWTDELALRVKTCVAHAVRDAPENALLQPVRIVFDTLVERLKERVVRLRNPSRMPSRSAASTVPGSARSPESPG